MDYRQLGASGLRVSTITLGTMGFAGTGWAKPVGNLDVDGARRQIDAGPRRRASTSSTPPTSTRPGSRRRSSGAALGSDRDDVLIATKVRMQIGDADGPNDVGLSRYHIIHAVEAQPAPPRHRPHRPLPGARVGRPDPARGDPRRRSTRSCRSGKVRYVGASNYTGWQLMKALWAADRHGDREVRQPADLLLAAGARRRERAGARSRSTRVSASSSGARSPAACCRASTAAARTHPEGTPPLPGLDRAARPRRGPALRHDRRARRDRRGPRRLRRAGRAGLDAGQAGRHLADRRRPHGGAAGRQPRGRRPRAERGRDRAASTRSAAPLPYPHWHQANAGPTGSGRPPSRCCVRTSRSTTDLPRSTAEAQGVDPAGIVAFLDALEAAPDIELHSLMVVRHGRLVAEGWWSPYAPGPAAPALLAEQELHRRPRSASPVDEGLVDLDATVLSLLPRARRRHHRPAQPLDAGPARRRDGQRPPRRDARPRPGARPGRPRCAASCWSRRTREPGTRLRLQPAVHLHARRHRPAAVRADAGRVPPAAAASTRSASAPVGWQQRPVGARPRLHRAARDRPTRSPGSACSTCSAACWDGPAAARARPGSAEATSRQVDNPHEPNPDWRQGYGFQFWMARHGFRGDGAYGQFCVVLPEQDTVVAITVGHREHAGRPRRGLGAPAARPGPGRARPVPGRGRAGGPAGDARHRPARAAARRRRWTRRTGRTVGCAPAPRGPAQPSLTEVRLVREDGPLAAGPLRRRRRDQLRRRDGGVADQPRRDRGRRDRACRWRSAAAGSTTTRSGPT